MGASGRDGGARPVPDWRGLARGAGASRAAARSRGNLQASDDEVVAVSAAQRDGLRKLVARQNAVEATSTASAHAWAYPFRVLVPSTFGKERRADG
jgi:hypothetical protein